MRCFILHYFLHYLAHLHLQDAHPTKLLWAHLHRQRFDIFRTSPISAVLSLDIFYPLILEIPTSFFIFTFICLTLIFIGFIFLCFFHHTGVASKCITFTDDPVPPSCSSMILAMRSFSNIDFIFDISFALFSS